MLKRGYKQVEIADALGKDQSAISREIQRNKVRGTYDSEKAHHKAYVRSHETRYQFSVIHQESSLERYVVEKLKKGFSPQAISGRMKYEHQPWYASKTAIYDWLYSRYGQRYCVYLEKRKYAKKRRGKKKTKRTLIPKRVSIHKRPKLTKRDYEGDTIVCSQSTASLATMYNPIVMYLDARKVLNLKPKVVARAFDTMLSHVDAKSLTLDNGQENRLHTKLSVKTYFCDPYSSWQKSGVENANRLLRKHFPKGTDLSTISPSKLASVVKKYNNTPRKNLGWKTPHEVMTKKNLFKIKKSRQ